MINRFLKAKHWQLFVLTVGVPLVFQFVMMGAMVFNLSNRSNHNLATILNFLRFIPLLLLLFLAPLYGWFWSVGIGLQNKVPLQIPMKVKKFKVSLLIPIFYTLALAILLGFTFDGLLAPGAKPNLGLIGGFFGVIIPMHLFSIVCIFYSLYFIAKTIKTVELQKNVELRDFVGEFVLIWFYFIGI